MSLWQRTKIMWWMAEMGYSSDEIRDVLTYLKELVDE